MKKHLYVLMSFILPSITFGQGTMDHTFIDFNNFEERIQETYPDPDNQLLSVNGQAIAQLGAEMFLLENWLVSLQGSSGENDISQRDSYAKRVTSAEQGTVLGVRARFPDWPYAGEVVIKPKFPILPFAPEGQYANINNGVVTNVGGIKSVSMWANGRNFAFTMGLRVTDVKGKLREFGLGSLFYVGWRKLVYNNPFFSDRPINNIRPNTRIYPSEVPLLRFKEIAVYKPHNEPGKDFIGYFGNIDISYTPYIAELPTDINDEETWGLVREEQVEKARKLNDALYSEILQYEYAKQRVQTDDADQEGQADEGAEDQVQ